MFVNDMNLEHPAITAAMRYGGRYEDALDCSMCDEVCDFNIYNGECKRSKDDD